MFLNKPAFCSILHFALLGLVVTAASSAVAQVEVVLHAFNPNNGDGVLPDGGLVAGKFGYLYSTTNQGGSAGWGTVYEMIPPTGAGGAWTETILHSFQNGSDGAEPVGSLTVDDSGDLFGTTFYGGLGINQNSYGIAFELTPPADPSGQWTYTILCNFDSGTVAINPNGGMILDEHGNLYGTSDAGTTNEFYCGDYPCGNVYELQPPSTSGGSWTGRSIYNFFTQGTTDGIGPNGIVFGPGVIYGTTTEGGENNSGTIFQLTPPDRPNGTWTEKILYNFLLGYGSPLGGLVLGPKGSLFGSTQVGGPHGYGSIYQMTLEEGTWNENILYSFTGGSDGGYPVSVMRGEDGNLYGATSGGAIQNGEGCLPGGAGTEFALTPTSGGWQEITLHQFAGGTDGCNPAGRPLQRSNSLFGVTEYGGSPPYGLGGTVFRVTP